MGEVTPAILKCEMSSFKRMLFFLLWFLNECIFTMENTPEGLEKKNNHSKDLENCVYTINFLMFCLVPIG